MRWDKVTKQDSFKSILSGEPISIDYIPRNRKQRAINYLVSIGVFQTKEIEVYGTKEYHLVLKCPINYTRTHVSKRGNVMSVEQLIEKNQVHNYHKWVRILSTENGVNWS